MHLERPQSGPGRGYRWRADRDRERAQPGRAGAARPRSFDDAVHPLYLFAGAAVPTAIAAAAFDS